LPGIWPPQRSYSLSAPTQGFLPSAQTPIAIGLIPIWHDNPMSQAGRGPAADGVTALGHEVFEIDTRMAGHDKITANVAGIMHWLGKSGRAGG